MQRILVPILLLLCILCAFLSCDFLITPPEDRTNPADSESTVAFFQAYALSSTRVGFDWEFRGDQLPAYKVVIKAHEIPRSPEDGQQITDVRILDAGAGGMEGAVPDGEADIEYFAALFVQKPDSDRWIGPYYDSFSLTEKSLILPVTSFVVFDNTSAAVEYSVDGLSTLSTAIDSTHSLGIRYDHSLLEDKKVTAFGLALQFSSWNDIADLANIRAYYWDGDVSAFDWALFESGLTDQYVLGSGGAVQGDVDFSLGDFHTNGRSSGMIVLRCNGSVVFDYDGFSDSLAFEGAYYEK